MTPVREAFSGLFTDEAAAAYEEPFVSTFRELMNQPGIRRVLYQSEPHGNNPFYDIWAGAPVELPREPTHIRLSFRIDDSDNNEHHPEQ